MVYTDLNRCEDPSQSRAHPHVSSEGIIDSAKEHRGKSESEHFGNVPRTDNNKEVGRKAVRQRGHDREPRVEPHATEHEKEHGHRDEDQRSGLSEEIERPRERFDDRSLILYVDQIGGHSAEHIPLPLGVLPIFFAVLHNILNTSFILQDIVLSEHFPVELRGEVEHIDYNEEDQRSHDRTPLFEDLFILHADKPKYVSLQSNEKMLTKPNGKPLLPGKHFPFIFLCTEDNHRLFSLYETSDQFPFAVTFFSFRFPSIYCNTTVAKTGK